MDHAQTRTSRPTRPIASRVRAARRAAAVLGVVAVVAVTALSAIAAKEAVHAGARLPALARVEALERPAEGSGLGRLVAERLQTERPAPAVAVESRPPELYVPAGATDAAAGDDAVRWFDGRPVRPVRTVLFTVTGYSPDERSCGPYADGQTATLHSVFTNGMQLVAADPKVLPYGSMLTVPGYADDSIVPVLDCGGAIKGQRLDLLFPTHEIARQWGVRKVPVTIWAYADGQPAPNPRVKRGR
jgi:3D (Asp-Asp-Asp) domain-containing protein